MINFCAYSQTENSQRNELVFGVIGSGFFNKDRLFYILNMRYERRMSLLNDKWGVGLSYNHVTSNFFGDKEFALGPFLNYHFLKPNCNKLDPYIGVGYVYSQKNRMGSQIGENFHFKYQYGMRFSLSKNFSLLIEGSNFRFNGGFFPTNRVARESGPFPTLGAVIKF